MDKDQPKMCPLRGGLVIQPNKLAGKQEIGRIDSPCAGEPCMWWSSAKKQCCVSAMHDWILLGDALKSLDKNCGG